MKHIVFHAYFYLQNFYLLKIKINFIKISENAIGECLLPGF